MPEASGSEAAAAASAAAPAAAAGAVAAAAAPAAKAGGAGVSASSGEHQEYIQQKVNPILENLVTQLLLERPEPMAPFMIKWLSEHSKTPAAVALSEGVGELGAMKSELELLREEVKKLEAEVGEAKEPEDNEDESEEEEDDDDGDEADLPPPPAAYLNRGPRASVSAEAYGAWNKKEEYVPPVYPKTPEQTTRIKGILESCFLFSALEAKDFEVLINAMQEKISEKEECLIEQGADGSCLYVIEEGQMNCYKKIPDVPDDHEKYGKKVKECLAGDYFGELALLYNTPRAASVVAHERCVMWQLDRETFNAIVRDAASKRRERYDAFLKSVPILATIEQYERNQMCDALQTQAVQADTTIVKQGDPGDRFFILEDGECVVMKSYVEGVAPQEVMSYSQGDYFGELALLRNEPRAATVIAKTDCKLLYVNRRVFKMLLGPLEDILTRNSSKYA